MEDVLQSSLLQWIQFVNTQVHHKIANYGLFCWTLVLMANSRTLSDLISVAQFSGIIRWGSRECPPNLQLAENILPATQRVIAWGDIWKKKTSFNPALGNNAIESLLSSNRFQANYERKFTTASTFTNGPIRNPYCKQRFFTGIQINLLMTVNVLQGVFLLITWRLIGIICGFLLRFLLSVLFCRKARPS
jgi:hypothetical protein